MNDKHQKIEQLLEHFKKEFSKIMQKYPTDARKDLLTNLVKQLCAATSAHVQLMVSETNGRFLISESDYHKILESYLTLFKEIKTMPRARPRSIYEIALVSDLDTIIKSHCQGEEVE